MNLRVCAAILVVAAANGACGSSPEATLYALSPTQGEPRAGAPHAIKIRRLAIPAYLDRPEIVRGLVRFQLSIPSNERWGAPLDEMLERVLAEDIEQRSPGSIAFTEDDSITVEPDATVEVNLRRLEAGPSGDVKLVANIAIERRGGRAGPTTRSVALSKGLVTGGTAALVATISELIGELADQIAALLPGP